jgi:small subunit ribosomal protein S16
MLTIRFNRTGKKNRAQFRIVLQEHTVAPGGRHIAVLGSWDPHTKKTVINGEKVKEWMAKGAQVSDSVYNLMIKEGVLEGKKRAIKIKKSDEQKAAEAEAQKPKEVSAEPKAEEKVEEKKEESNNDQPKTE